MSFLSVEEDKCKRDGLCEAACPIRIIEIREPGALPSLVAEGEELCINCGHCVAVCPEGALRLDSMKPEDCAPVVRELLPSADHVEHFLKSRRSIRLYEQRPMKRETLSEEAVLLAANGQGSL